MGLLANLFRPLKIRRNFLHFGRQGADQVLLGRSLSFGQRNFPTRPFNGRSQFLCPLGLHAGSLSAAHFLRPGSHHFSFRLTPNPVGFLQFQPLGFHSQLTGGFGCMSPLQVTLCLGLRVGEFVDLEQELITLPGG